MQHDFEDFLRHGGNGRYLVARRGGQVYGYRAAVSIKATFPNYTTLHADFSDRLDDVIASNSRMLLNALTPPDSVPVVAQTDLRDVTDAKDEVLSQWEVRLESIFTEYQTHSQRLRPLRTNMEDRLLRAFAGLINQLRQEDLGIEHYVWRSQDDAKVRDSHADYDDRMFRWDTPPEGGHPGQAYNCRCYAEPIAAERRADVVLADFEPTTDSLDPIRLLDGFLSGLNEDFSAGLGVRPQSLLDRFFDGFYPEPGVTINGEMLDIQTQGVLAIAFLELGEAIKDDPQAFLTLVERRGDGFARLAAVFGISNPEGLAIAAALSAAGAPEALVDEAVTQSRSAVDRFVGGTATALVESVQAIRGIPDIRWDDIRRAAEAIYADPSSLPEAMVEPFRERIAVGDYAGALGYGLPEVLAGVAVLGRVRRRAESLSAPEELTLERLRTDPDFEGITNAGPYAPRFERWINLGGTVELMPDGNFRYTAEVEVLGQSQRVSVEYPNGYPDFEPFMTHPSGVRSVEIDVTGTGRIDNHRANIEAGHPEWGSGTPTGWVWHHVEDARTMQLIPRVLNESFYHQGGASIARNQ